MKDIVDLEEARLESKAKRGYRNWKSRFGEDFGPSTLLGDISFKTLGFLVRGKGECTFYLYDLIMNLRGLGSGFEFNELDPKDKMKVMDQYLFLLDRIRFEYMKRLGWLEGYPGEGVTLVELITKFDRLAPGMHAKPPVLSKEHPLYKKFSKMDLFGKEELIRKLIPQVLQEIRNQSKTL